MCIFNFNHSWLGWFDFNHFMSITWLLKPLWLPSIVSRYTTLSSQVHQSPQYVGFLAKYVAMKFTEPTSESSKLERKTYHDSLLSGSDKQPFEGSPWHRARAMRSSLLLWRKPRHCSRASETSRTNAPASREACSRRIASAPAWSKAACISSVLGSPFPTRERGRRSQFGKEWDAGLTLGGLRMWLSPFAQIHF